MPVRQLADTESAYRSAQAADAMRVPRAAMHLDLAAEQMQRAQRLMSAKEYERAYGALLRAKLDAELALALAQRDRTDKEVRAALGQLARLRQQANADETNAPPDRGPGQE
jgi:hypothetical protein